MELNFETEGNFSRLEAFLGKFSHGGLYNQLEKYAQMGISTLESSTPTDSGLAAESWYYEIEISTKQCTIHWCNRDLENGFPVAVMLQYGYSTGTGGYVSPRDYINPAIRPVFDQIAESVWKAVTSA